jgi:hypothetical protein
MMMESSFYINIFDEFLDTEDDPQKKLMWELKSIINLMQKAKGLDDDFCENGLRMILTLFNDYKIEPWEVFVNGEENSKNLFDDSELVKILFEEVS